MGKELAKIQKARKSARRSLAYARMRPGYNLRQSGAKAERSLHARLVSQCCSYHTSFSFSFTSPTTKRQDQTRLGVDMAMLLRYRQKPPPLSQVNLQYRGFECETWDRVHSSTTMELSFLLLVITILEQTVSACKTKSCTGTQQCQDSTTYVCT